MSGDDSDWAENPMERDYYSLNFNCYIKGPGAKIPNDRLPSAKRESDRNLDPLKLYVAQIPLDMTQNGLRNYMCSIGCPTPTYMKLSRGKIGSTLCLYQYAFLAFERTRDASEALQLLNRKEPYFFKANFANKPGEKERLDKLRTSQIREVNVENDFQEYLKSKRSEKNNWQQCTTFTDDIENDVGISSISENSNKFDNTMESHNENGSVDSIQQLTKCGLVKFLGTKDQSCNYCSFSPIIEHVHYIIDEGRICNPLEAMPILKDVTCHYCKENNEIIFMCEKCKVTTYCCKFCQINDWSHHAKHCGSQLK